MWNPTGAITGSAVVGLTSPTYTVTADTAPDVNGKQVAVTTLGGTQTGVATHSVTNPFTATFWKPKTFKFLGKPHPVTGLIADVPTNVFKQVVRKGLLPAAGQPLKVGLVTITLEIPAGSELADSNSISAMISFAGGLMASQVSGINDTVKTGLV
ncbi:coat protein [ssRNA phage SRR7976356_4]|uniref:Coat protein n=1 Tax=ssRNA phage SRR7976356_4 TaxID=2786735 RepID=A0A8S5L1K1_9VIRU|nr:coat protein [ssRNA phage SRR7976356_4]DAD51229.1 TPA_asm: coat protein [ssRNA phage SRR7976356_4]